jgi:hypothetical protein
MISSLSLRFFKYEKLYNEKKFNLHTWNKNETFFLIIFSVNNKVEKNGEIKKIILTMNKLN